MRFLYDTYFLFWSLQLNARSGIRNEQSEMVDDQLRYHAEDHRVDSGDDDEDNNENNSNDENEDDIEMTDVSSSKQQTGKALESKVVKSESGKLHSSSKDIQVRD